MKTSMFSTTIIQPILLGVMFFICITKVTSFPVFPGRKPVTKDDGESNTDSSPCSCNKTTITPLNDSQKLALRAAMTDRTFLERLAAFQKGEDGNMMISSKMQTPIVTLNVDQKRQILQNYRELFTKKPELKTLQDFQNKGRMRRVSGTNAEDDVTTTVQRSLRIREINQASGVPVSLVQGARICQPVQAYESFVMTLDENYDPVQIVQVSLQDINFNFPLITGKQMK